MMTAYRLRNLLMRGGLTSAELTDLLAQTPYMGALYDICGSERMVADCLSSAISRPVLLDCAAAYDALFTSIPVKRFFWGHKQGLADLLAVSAARTRLLALAVAASCTVSLSPLILGRGRVLISTLKGSSSASISVRSASMAGATGVTPLEKTVNNSSSGAVLLTAMNAVFYISVASGSPSFDCTYVNMDA